MDDENQSFSEEQEKEFYSDSKDDYGYEQNNNSYKSSSYYEEIKEENVLDEFKQFYSPSAYIVLGVSQNDSFSDIKKSYGALVRICHPDLNPDETEQYTEISQNINEAYSKLKKIHGK
jgi:DnaJ-class molecular chaperone